MKLTRTTLLRSAAAVSIAFATMGSAHADAFAESILTISNFRLLHSSGAAFNATDFGLLTGTNDAHATAQLGSVFSNGAQSFGILSGINPNVPHQTVGTPNPARGEDDFLPFPSITPVPGTFGYADQQLLGSSITVGATPAGATARTRANASLAMNGVAAGNSDVGTSTTFNFVLGVGDNMTVAFDATPWTSAYVSPGSTATTNANARLSWSISIIDITTNLTVFTYAPPEINALSNVSRTDGMPGLTQYHPGLITGLAASTPFLNNTDTYQITIQHNTLANALQAQIPEPGTLAIFGLGLLGVSVMSRRRKA